MDDRIVMVRWLTTGIEAAVVRPGRKSIQVLDRARADGNTGPGADAGVLFQQALAALAGRAPIDALGCIVLISPAWFQFRLMFLPFRKRQDIERVLPFEIDPTIVGGMEAMAVDFDVVGNSEKGALVLAACLEKRRIETLAAACAPYRLRIARILPLAYAMARGLIFREAGQGGEWVLIEAESPRDISLAGVSAGNVRFMRHLQLDAPLAQRDTAAWRELGMEIRRTLLAERERADFAFSPDFGIFLGDGNDWGSAEAREWLGQAADMPIRTMGSIIGADAGAASGEDIVSPLRVQMQGARMAGGLDFCPRNRSLRTFWNTSRRRILWTAALAGICAVSGLAYVGMDMILSARRAKNLDRMISERFYEVFSREVPMVEPVQQLRTKIRELEADPLLAFSGNSARAIDILDAFSRDVLAGLDVLITRMGIEPGKLSVTGHASDYESVYEMKRRIEKPGSPASANIQSATQEPRQNRVIFSMDISGFNP